MNTRRLSSLAVMLGLYLLPAINPASSIFLSIAYADTSNKDIAVSSSVPSNCNFNSGGGGGGGATINFGTYNAIGTHETIALTSNMNFDIRCNKGTAVIITLDTGQHANGSIRRLHANGEYLSYELYKDAAYTQIWGQNSANDMDYIATSSAPSSPTVYAKIAPGQDVSIGTYTDTVTITASF